MNLKKLFIITLTVKLVKTLKRHTQVIIAYSYCLHCMYTFLRHTYFITHISIHISGGKHQGHIFLRILYY